MIYLYIFRFQPLLYQNHHEENLAGDLYSQERSRSFHSKVTDLDQPYVMERKDQDQPYTMERKDQSRKTLSLTQILLLNSVVCGVEVCACAGFTYIPPMLLKAGYAEENMSIILGLGPLFGFIFVPLIGQASDHCKSSFGRRRPFILGISSLLVTSLLLIPYGDLISSYFLGATQAAKTLTLAILTISVVLLDFTSQACLTPCEALLSDASKGTSQKDRVFMVYSQMISLGGFLGYLITALDWTGNSVGHFFGGQERTVFTMLIFIFLILLSATMFVAQEQPLATVVMEEQSLPLLNQSPQTLTASIMPGPLESGYESSDADENDTDHISRSPSRTRKNRKRSKHSTMNPVKGFTILFLSFILRLKLIAFIMNILKSILSVIYRRLPESVRKLFDVPVVLKYLALANFCSWTALMGFNLFFTDFMGQWVYQGNPNAPENSYLRNNYDEGVRMGSWGLLLHCITSTSYAFFVEGLVEKHGTRKTYTFGMFTFTLAMFSMVANRNVIFVNAMAAVTGFAYATLTTIPFILITKYHSCKEVSILLIFLFSFILLT